MSGHRTFATHERNEIKPWALTDAPETFVEAMLRGIIGFRLAITRLEGKWKMSQNRETKNRDGVVRGLGKRGAAMILRWPRSSCVTSSRTVDCPMGVRALAHQARHILSARLAKMPRRRSKRTAQD